MIEIRHLRKEYDRAKISDEKSDGDGAVVALENLHLEVPKGEVMGLIGPNGAGKTTLIRILATLLEPTYGHVRIGGIDALEEPLKVHPLIGYMSDFFSLYEDLLVWEYLDHFARCYRIPSSDRPKLIDEMLQLVSLEDKRDSDIKTLSRGIRQRLCLAKTLLHRPQVLLLDEPASGLDPAARIEFREIIKKLWETGYTVFISSHILTEMTAFCTSIAILEHGRLLESGRVAEVVEKLQGGLRITIETLGDTGPLRERLQSDSRICNVEANGQKIVFRFAGKKEDIPELHRRLVTAGILIVSFETRTDNLEDIYMKIAKHKTS